MPIKRRGRDPSKVFDELKKGVQLRAPDALIRAALVLEGNIKRILLTPGTGRLYGKHRASAPGEPPAPDTGTLQRSITHALSRPAGGRGRLGSGIATSVRVGSNIKAASALEYGTTSAGKNHNTVIAPRPCMRPAFAASREAMTSAVVAALKRGNRRGS